MDQYAAGEAGIPLAFRALFWGGRKVLRPFGLSDDPRVQLSSPYDHSIDKNMTWWHISVSNEKRWGRWPAKDVFGATVELTFASRADDTKITTGGMWSAVDLSGPKQEMSVRVGGLHRRIPIVVMAQNEVPARSGAESPYTTIPGGQTLITGFRFITEHMADQVLSAGEWDVTVSINHNTNELVSRHYKLVVPSSGLTGFKLTSEDDLRGINNGDEPALIADPPAVSLPRDSRRRDVERLIYEVRDLAGQIAHLSGRPESESQKELRQVVSQYRIKWQELNREEKIEDLDPIIADGFSIWVGFHVGRFLGDLGPIIGSDEVKKEIEIDEWTFVGRMATRVDKTVAEVRESMTGEVMSSNLQTSAEGRK